MSHPKLSMNGINPFLPDLCEMTAKNRRFFAVISHKSGKKGFIPFKYRVKRG
jgi:hypothetical protein